MGDMDFKLAGTKEGITGLQVVYFSFSNDNDDGSENVAW